MGVYSGDGIPLVLMAWPEESRMVGLEING
jgi:hypothetical protein